MVLIAYDLQCILSNKNTKILQVIAANTVGVLVANGGGTRY